MGKKTTDRRGIIMSIKWEDIDDFEIDGVDHKDYPEYTDAYISFALTKYGHELNDEELEKLNDDYPEVKYEYIHYGH